MTGRGGVTPIETINWPCVGMSMQCNQGHNRLGQILTWCLIVQESCLGHGSRLDSFGVVAGDLQPSSVGKCINLVGRSPWAVQCA
jgi:hypothetical protein